MDKVEEYMKRWHIHQRELKKGGATWCLACLEYGHLPDVCPYEDPLFVQVFDRGEVETAEEWIHLKAIPLPHLPQRGGVVLCCRQPPPWQDVELLVLKKGRRGSAKKVKKWAPAPRRGEPVHPVPRRGEPMHPAPRSGEPCIQRPEGGSPCIQRP
ncbi:UNVERIFIED_CONTAM: hypothetical protein FKN15_045127 [Acipenser sinensis]